WNRLLKWRMRIERQAQGGLTSAHVFAVFQRQRPAMGFGNLTAQYQADSAAAGLCSEEGHKQIVAVEQARALVADEDFYRLSIHIPSDLYRARSADRWIQRRVHRVTHNID